MFIEHEGEIGSTYLENKLQIRYAQHCMLFVTSFSLQYYTYTAAAKSLQSCLTLCDPTAGSPPGSSIPGILQARVLEWVAISFSNTCMPAKLLQSCSTLCNPMDSSPPGSSVHGILRLRILEWVAMPSSRGSSQLRDGTCVSYVSCIGRQVLYHQHHLGSPSNRDKAC